MQVKQKECTCFFATVENARYWLNKGFDGVAYRQDTAVFQDAFKSVVKQIKTDLYKAIKQPDLVFYETISTAQKTSFFHKNGMLKGDVLL